MRWLIHGTARVQGHMPHCKMLLPGAQKPMAYHLKEHGSCTTSAECYGLCWSWSVLQVVAVSGLLDTGMRVLSVGAEKQDDCRLYAHGQYCISFWTCSAGSLQNVEALQQADS